MVSLGMSSSKYTAIANKALKGSRTFLFGVRLPISMLADKTINGASGEQ